MYAMPNLPYAGPADMSVSMGLMEKYGHDLAAALSSPEMASVYDAVLQVGEPVPSSAPPHPSFLLAAFQTYHRLLPPHLTPAAC